MAEKPGKFDFKCPKCGTIHHRSMWSLAHTHIRQTFTCPECGEVSILEPEE